MIPVNRTWKTRYIILCCLLTAAAVGWLVLDLVTAPKKNADPPFQTEEEQAEKAGSVMNRLKKQRRELFVEAKKPDNLATVDALVKDLARAHKEQRELFKEEVETANNLATVDALVKDLAKAHKEQRETKEMNDTYLSLMKETPDPKDKRNLKDFVSRYKNEKRLPNYDTFVARIEIRLDLVEQLEQLEALVASVERDHKTGTPAECLEQCAKVEKFLENTVIGSNDERFEDATEKVASVREQYQTEMTTEFQRLMNATPDPKDKRDLKDFVSRYKNTKGLSDHDDFVRRIQARLKLAEQLEQLERLVASVERDYKTGTPAECLTQCAKVEEFLENTVIGSNDERFEDATEKVASVREQYQTEMTTEFQRLMNATPDPKDTLALEFFIFRYKNAKGLSNHDGFVRGIQARLKLVEQLEQLERLVASVERDYKTGTPAECLTQCAKVEEFLANTVIGPNDDRFEHASERLGRVRWRLDANKYLEDAEVALEQENWTGVFKACDQYEKLPHLDQHEDVEDVTEKFKTLRHRAEFRDKFFAEHGVGPSREDWPARKQWLEDLLEKIPWGNKREPDAVLLKHDLKNKLDAGNARADELDRQRKAKRERDAGMDALAEVTKDRTTELATWLPAIFEVYRQHPSVRQLCRDEATTKVRSLELFSNPPRQDPWPPEWVLLQNGDVLRGKFRRKQTGPDPAYDYFKTPDDVQREKYYPIGASQLKQPPQATVPVAWKQEVRQLRNNLSSRKQWLSLSNLSRQLLGGLEPVKEQNSEPDLIKFLKFLQNAQRDADTILKHMPKLKEILNPTDV